MVKRRQWILAAAGVLMIAAAVVLAVGSRAQAPPRAIPIASRTDSVSLFVQHDGAALNLHWNPDSDAIRRASSGALFIDDGGRRSKLDLRPGELASGVASYWPTSPSVTFRLDLDGVPAGELEAPALEVRHEDRPSPFSSAEPKRVESNTAARVEEPSDDMPKPYTIRAADAPSRAAAEPPRAAAAPPFATAAPARTVAAPPRTAAAPRPAVRTEPKPDAAPERKPSGWRRITGKIPLLRRLGHRQ